MQTSMTVLIAVIVVLITGLIILTIFGVNIPIISDFINALVGRDPCTTACIQFQYVCNEDRAYNQLPLCNDPARTDICKCNRAAG